MRVQLSNRRVRHRGCRTQKQTIQATGAASSTMPPAERTGVRPLGGSGRAGGALGGQESEEKERVHECQQG